MVTRADVLVIGGGPAGLAAAQVLGRQRRRVVLVDGHQPRNAAASGVHLMLGREGVAPEALLAAAREELAGLRTVSLLPADATDVLMAGPEFLVSTSAGDTYSAEYLILATGVLDQLPPVPGIEAAYGTSLFPCPLCDGFEVRDQPLVVLGGSEHAALMAAYVHDRISRQVQLCSNGEPGFSPVTRNRLALHGIGIVEGVVAGIHGGAAGLALRMRDSTTNHYRAGFVPVSYRQRSPLARELGCIMRDDGRVRVDHFQRTSVPRVFAVGDMAKTGCATGNMTFVATAVAGGVTAAAFLDEDIFAQAWQGTSAESLPDAGALPGTALPGT